MASFWIITDRRPHRHFTLAKARAEQERLQALHPDKRFTVLRCKSYVEDSGEFDTAKWLLAALLAASECPDLSSANNEIGAEADSRLRAAQENARAFLAADAARTAPVEDALQPESEVA